LAEVPASKAEVLRGLVIAAGLGGACRLSVARAGWSSEGEAELEGSRSGGLERVGEDVSAGFACAEAMGCGVLHGALETQLLREVAPAHGGSLPVGESGFLGRVAPAVAALGFGGRWEVHAAGSLAGRSSEPLWCSLEAAGLRVERGKGWITAISGADDLGPIELVEPCSSQEVSALLIGLASRGGGELQVQGEIPSQPYVELTVEMLREAGVEVSATSVGYRVGPARLGGASLIADHDASSAAVAVAAGCLSGVRVASPRPCRHKPLQGDWRFVEHLQTFGCLVETEGAAFIGAGPPSRGAELDLRGEPDLAPVLVVVAACAALRGGGESQLTGLGTLDGKESARGAVLAEGLRAAGFDCAWSGSSMRVGGLLGEPQEVALDALGDHRMAFAFALLGLICPGVSVTGGECVAKSWPGFWTTMGE